MIWFVITDMKYIQHVEAEKKQENKFLSEISRKKAALPTL